MEDNKYTLLKDDDNIVQIVQHPTKPGQNSYGEYWMYKILKNNQEKIMFINSKNLKNKLDTYGEGSSVNIRKDEYAPNKFAWNVIPQGETQPRKTLATVTKDVIDNRTHDIHKQVCLKLAFSLVEKKNELLTTGDLVIIEANMVGLLNVLEGKLESVRAIEPSSTLVDEENPPF